MKAFFLFLFIVFAQLSFSQIEDCVGAYPVCGNGDISLVPDGAGIDDFLPTNNYTPDCFRGGNGTQTTWLRLVIKQSGTLGFTIIPYDNVGPDRDDYDFAVYKTDDCENLGRSIRCSTTNPQNANVGAETGLSPNETETSEGPGSDGNGFVRWLDTSVGEVYYIFIDNFSQDEGYTLKWEGSALLEDRISKENGGVDLGDDIAICVNDQIQLNATITGGVKYTWNTGATTPIITVRDTGIYSVTAENSAGCISTDEIEVTYLPKPEISAIGFSPNNECEVVDITFTADGSLGSYDWFNATGTKVGSGKNLIVTNLSASDSGVYELILTDENGCTDQDKVEVVINPKPVLNLNGRTSYCENEQIELSLNGEYIYKWYDFNNNLISTSNTFTKIATINDSGEYRVIAETSFGCTEELKFSISVEIELTVSADINNINLCSNDSQTITALANNVNATIKWYNPNNEEIANGKVFNLTNLSVQDSGVYKVIATNAIGCIAVDEINVQINQAYLFEEEVINCPGNYFTVPQTGEIITEDTFVEVNLLTTEQCDSIYTYNVQYLDCGDESCSSVPSSFVPNFNNKNETFRPLFSSICTPTNFKLEIFNRWGENIATITDANKGWDGTHNSKKAISGVYIWKMSYVFEDNPSKTYNTSGSVTLIR